MNASIDNGKLIPRTTILKFIPNIKKEKKSIKFKSKKNPAKIEPRERRKIEVLDSETLKKLLKEKSRIETEPNGNSTGQNGSTPDIIKEIFGISDETLTDQDNIKIIVYKESDKDETIGSFETLCMKIYKERHGGKPPYKLIQKESNYNIDELENWLDGEESITRIDIDKEKIWEKLTKKENLDDLKQLLSRTVNKNLGFIIFKTKSSDKYWYLFELFNEDQLSSHNLNIYCIEARSYKKEIKKELSKLFWGNIKITEDANETPYTFDTIFNKFTQKKYKEFLKSLKSKKDGLFKYSTRKNSGKKSKEHFLIKIYLLAMFVEICEVALVREEIMKKIITEYNLIDKKTADLFVDTSKLSDTAYEIETLFGTGKDGNEPMDKITDTIEKYEGTKIKNIKIILENFTLIRHIKNLLNLKQIMRSWEKEVDKKVEFLTLDIENNSLISLEVLLKKIRKLLKKI